MATTFDLTNRNMKSFCGLFAEELRKSDPRQAEMLFHSLFQQDTWELATTRQRNTFIRMCRQLVKYHHYFALMEFVRGMILREDQYELGVVYDLISQVKIREDYDLAQLCQDYVREVQEENEFYEPLPLDVDLYHHLPGKVDLAPGDGGIQPAMVKTLLRHVYQLDCEDAKLTTAHIDELVAKVRQQVQDEHEAWCRDTDEQNEALDKTHVKSRVARPTLLRHQQDRGIPGMLIPFMMLSYENGDIDLFYYILEQYAVPVLAEMPWEQAGEESLPLMVEAASCYADYLQVKFYGAFPYTEFSVVTDPQYLEKSFYYEALGKGNEKRYLYTGEDLKRYCASHDKLFSMWGDVLHRGGSRLKTAINSRGYSFHILNTAFVMFFSGRQEEASQFLLQHYSDMDCAERRKPHIQILLARSILASPRLETANALYGLFNYEMDCAVQDRANVMSLSRGMLSFMRDARAYIEQTGRDAGNGRVSEFEFLFGNGKIDSYMDKCAKILASGNVLPEREFTTVGVVVDCFSYQSGIRLHPMGFPNYDDCDKIYHALSPELVHIGRGYAERCKEAKVFYTRLAQYEPLRNINLHLQNHLFKLQRKEVEQNLRRVNALKRNLPQELTEEEQESILADISEIARDIMVLTQGSTLRPEVERKITALRESFEEEYLQGQTDLMLKLPAHIRSDVHNYLVTSNMVFGMMEAQNDDTLDFSAALISMTKALELVMTYVYSRMDVKEYEGMSDESREFYFKNGVPIKTQTLRPCIEVLKGRARFAQWGGEDVLDISMLRRFSNIELQTWSKKKNTIVPMRFRTGASGDDQNMDALFRALSYICENYRNRSAHVEVVTITKVKECHQLLIDGQKLLWILLAILKE